MGTPYLRLAVLEEHKLTRLARKVVPDETAVDARVETQIHQRQCLRCQRWFWAWSPERRKCFVCDPPPPAQLERILREIYGTDVRAIEPELLAVSG